MYLVAQAEESEELNGLIRLRLLISEFEGFAPLTLANVDVRGFWDSSIHEDLMGIIRVATQVEQDLLGVDVIFSINKETVAGFDEAGLANVIAERLN